MNYHLYVDISVYVVCIVPRHAMTSASGLCCWGPLWFVGRG